MRFRIMATFGLLCLTGGRYAESMAQALPPIEVAERQAAIGALRDSQWVRVVTPTLARQQGRLLSHVGKDLVLAPETDSLLHISSPLLHISSLEIDTLWVRGGASKTGAVVGGVVGGALGVAAGISFALTFSVAGSTPSPSTGEVVGLAVVGGIGGLAGGALIGALIGTTIPKWHRRLP